MGLCIDYLVYLIMVNTINMDEQPTNVRLTNPKQAIMYIVLLILIIVGYFYTLFDEVAMLKRVYQQSALLQIRTAVVPLIAMMPAFGVLIWGISKRLNNKVSTRSPKRGLFIIITCFIMFLIGWVIYSWQLMSWLQGNGYTECSWYSGASLGAPQIMVNNAELCIEEGYQVRIELLDWFELQHQQGIIPTLEMVATKQQQLLLDYRQRFDLL